MANGAPADLFVSANQSGWIIWSMLKRSMLTAENLVKNTLVLIAEK